MVRSRSSVTFAIFALVSFSALEGMWGQGAKRRLLKKSVHTALRLGTWVGVKVKVRSEVRVRDRVSAGLGGCALAQGTVGVAHGQPAPGVTGLRFQGLHRAAVILPEELIEQGRVLFQGPLSSLQLRLLLSHQHLQPLDLTSLHIQGILGPPEQESLSSLGQPTQVPDVGAARPTWMRNICRFWLMYLFMLSDSPFFSAMRGGRHLEPGAGSGRETQARGRGRGHSQLVGSQSIAPHAVLCCKAQVITETMGEWALSPAKGEKALLIYYISMLGDWSRWEESLLL